MKRAVQPLAKLIEQTILDARSGKAGRRHIAIATMEKLPAEVLAYLTVRECISAAIQIAPLTNTGLKLGSSIEEELRLQAFDEQAPDLYHTIMRRLKERGAGAGHARKVFVFAANKPDTNVELPTIAKSDKLHIGIKLIELLIEATGFIEPVTVRMGKTKTRTIIRATEVAAKWMEDRNLAAELLSPHYAPMVVPPKDWEGVKGGGYISPDFKQLNLVKRCTKKQHKEVLARADLTQVLRALNAVQRTAWSINTDVLDVMTEVWDRSHEIAMPSRDDLLVPPYPAGHVVAETPEIAWANVHPDAKKAWMRGARKVYEGNASSRGKRMGISQIIHTAKTLAGEPEVFFPHQLDFRGRAYAVPIGLNPQGSDHAKALLHFAHGKPITTPRAAGWLAINGANLYGYDKAAFADRINWVAERQDQIIYTAQNPLGDLWWADADKPWCFLAWCFEYAKFLEEGYGFVSRFVCSVDGSCNGLQHFSAMLRDPIGGAAVNLVPGELPADIYQRVADRVIEKLQAEGDEWVPRGWIDFGITRKTTKRPVMVLPYGGTFKSCMEYVREAVGEQINDGKENPFGDELGKATATLARNVWDSIGDVVVAARTAMDWFQKCARVAAKAGIPLVWTTPSGFPVFQSYMDTTSRRVKTRLQGSLVFLSLSEDTDKIDAGRQALAVSPNAVHSLDASAMVLTINLCLDNAVTQFAMVHDSYGTVAADMDMLAACLRHAFVDMYVEHDVLAEFLAGLPEEVRAQCPPPPPKGSLDIRRVLDSEFFFA